VTGDLALVGATDTRADAMTTQPGLHLYGSEADRVRELPGAAFELAPGLSEAMVRFAARQEYACSVEDVLARRSRLLFLDAALAARSAERVGQILAEELGPGFDAAASVSAFQSLASQYQALP
jgi:glycerol-3-phosphate dehydrogenase